MNFILCPIRNGRELTRKALQTFLAQDIGDVGVLFIANAPEDGTMEMLNAFPDPRVHVSWHRPPLSVAASWNTGLRWIWKQGAECALVVNNDVELHPSTYRLLMDSRSNIQNAGQFVTAVGVRERGKFEAWSGIPTEPKRPHPDFSCYLIWREAWDKIGPYDENFNGAFAEDWDMHCRLHAAGITAYCIDLPFLHHASQTVKLAHPDEQKRIQKQAEANRAYFKKKWGFAGGSKEYYEYFGSSAPESEEQPALSS